MNYNNLIRVTKILTLFAVALVSHSAEAVTITFDDGVKGSPIEDHYSSLGVTFSHATFSNIFPGRPGRSGSLGLGGDFDNPNQNILAAFISPIDPIEVTFARPIDFASIVASDVGFNGARINAFDATTGGKLLDFDEFIGSKIGIGQFATLSVSDPNIRRLEIFQPNCVSTSSGSCTLDDGVEFDEFTFNYSTSQPVPEHIGIVGTVVALGFGILFLRK